MRRGRTSEASGKRSAMRTPSARRSCSAARRSPRCFQASRSRCHRRHSSWTDHDVPGSLFGCLYLDGWLRRPLRISACPDGVRMTDDAQSVGMRETLDDLVSHREAWRVAIVRTMGNSPPATVDSDDKLYWHHELRAFDRVFAALAAQSPAAP